MDCPSCGKTVAAAAWICGFCDHILDPSVLGVDEEERTSIIVWTPKAEDAEEVPDALILGDGERAEENDVRVVRGAVQGGDGRTATFLFYTAGATSRIIHPDAIPRMPSGDRVMPRTPYEDFVLSLIDGRGSVRDIHRASGLAPQEVVVTLLTLLDKKAIRIDAGTPARFLDGDMELEVTQAIQRPISNGPSSDSGPLPSMGDFDELIDEVSDALAKPVPLGRSDSFSDVWAESDEHDMPTIAENSPRPNKRNKRSDTKPPVQPAVLDPSFLVEVAESEDPVVAPLHGRRESTGKKRRARENQRRVLERAVKRGPIHERIRHDEPSAEKKTPSRVQAPKVSTGVGALETPNMSRASRLFEQAMSDQAEGNLLSARMNLKLAMTFDPNNEQYAKAFEALANNPAAQAKAGPTQRSQARELYDQATEAENDGQVDNAVELLEQAIGMSRQAAFLNRLGVILAMKKKDFLRAQKLVEEAIEIAPDNGAYAKNLSKILGMAATSDLKKQNDDKDPKRGLLGLLGRRK